MTTADSISASVYIANRNCETAAYTITLGLTDPSKTHRYHTKEFAIDSAFPIGTWVRLTATFENDLLTAIYPFVEFNDFSDGTIIYVDDAKLELGQTYTEYSPADD